MDESGNDTLVDVRETEKLDVTSGRSVRGGTSLLRSFRLLLIAAAAAVLGGGAGAGVYAALAPTTGAAPARVVAATPAGYARAASSTITEVYKRAVRGVVDIDVASSGGGTDLGPPLAPFAPFVPGLPSLQVRAAASGFVIDRDGHVVTNEHVVAGAKTIRVKLHGGKIVSARVVATDPSTDLAVLEIDVPASELSPLAFGNSAAVQPGEPVIAIGSPFGLAGSVSAGIVSGVGRRIQAPNGAAITDAIQTDAPINQGNSGGPLLDLRGLVIGVTAQIETSSGGNEGVGFAIPADTVERVVSALIEHGKVEHGFLGVRIAPTLSGTGALIASVEPGSPAARAGLQAGDVVVALDGKAIGSADDLSAGIAAHGPGDRVVLKVKRGAATNTIEVRLGSRSTSSA
jgi:S1-C subfamily serine protease